jgi:hypothetical protein
VCVEDVYTRHIALILDVVILILFNIYFIEYFDVDMLNMLTVDPVT